MYKVNKEDYYMSDITKIKVDGEPESSYQLYPRNEEFAKRAGGNGGSNVQPDWNQNDDTQLDYVKNRPFYTGGPVETVLLEETTATFSSLGQFYMAQISADFSLEVGATYKVYWDGTVYSCVGYDFSGLAAIGNQYIMNATSDTGEPFFSGIESGTLVIYTKDTSASHTVFISGYVPQIIKIDEKYLPVASDVNYGVIKKSEIITAYYFDDIAPHDSMVEAVTSFRKGKASIVWYGKNVINAQYNSSDDSISIGFSHDPYTIYTFKNLSGSYNSELGELSYSEISARRLRLYDENNPNIYSVISTSGDSSGDSVIELNADHIAHWGKEILNKKELFLFSSTTDSAKRFKITVDDSGTLTATEVT